MNKTEGMMKSSMSVPPSLLECMSKHMDNYNVKTAGYSAAGAIAHPGLQARA